MRLFGNFKRSVARLKVHMFRDSMHQYFIRSKNTSNILWSSFLLMKSLQVSTTIASVCCRALRIQIIFGHLIYVFQKYMLNRKRAPFCSENWAFEVVGEKGLLKRCRHQHNLLYIFFEFRTYCCAEKHMNTLNTVVLEMVPLMGVTLWTSEIQDLWEHLAENPLAWFVHALHQPQHGKHPATNGLQLAFVKGSLYTNINIPSERYHSYPVSICRSRHTNASRFGMKTNHATTFNESSTKKAHTAS